MSDHVSPCYIHFFFDSIICELFQMMDVGFETSEVLVIVSLTIYEPTHLFVLRNKWLSLCDKAIEEIVFSSQMQSKMKLTRGNIA